MAAGSNSLRGQVGLSILLARLIEAHSIRHDTSAEQLSTLTERSGSISIAEDLPRTEAFNGSRDHMACWRETTIKGAPAVRLQIADDPATAEGMLEALQTGFEAAKLKAG
jgi:hypothetical protein